MEKAKQPRLLDLVREQIRIRNYSLATEKCYLHWIKRYIYFHNKKHPRDMAEAEIGQFLSHLAVKLRVAAATQNQALNAIVFLYKYVIKNEINVIGNIVRAKQPQRRPIVFSQAEIKSIFDNVPCGQHLLIIRLLYGSGLRISECLSLRILDIDLERREIHVKNGKGMKDRITVLPDALVEPLKRQLMQARHYHDKDLEEGFGRSNLPFALDRKYPNAGAEFKWQYLSMHGYM